MGSDRLPMTPMSLRWPSIGLIRKVARAPYSDQSKSQCVATTSLKRSPEC